MGLNICAPPKNWHRSTKNFPNPKNFLEKGIIKAKKKKKKNTIEKIIIFKGLENIGEVCYMNAALQCLSNTDQLTKYFLNYDKEFLLDKHKMSYHYQKLIKHLWPSVPNSKISYKPKNFKEALGEENELFKGIKPNDSKDFINFMIERLHLELNDIINDDNINKNNLGEEASFSEEIMRNNFFLLFQNNYNSIISHLFYFPIEIKTTCCNCYKTRYNFQVHYFIEFNLEAVNRYLYLNGRIHSLYTPDGKNPDVNIYDGFRYQMKAEYLKDGNQIYCSICKTERNAVYSNQVYVFPNILMIYINRGKNATYKCNLIFPEELDLIQFSIEKKFNTKFELYGVICHIGESSSFGHFVAFCKNRINQKWILYNDAIVNECCKDRQYLTYMPYILFYKVKNEG